MELLLGKTIPRLILISKTFLINNHLPIDRFLPIDQVIPLSRDLKIDPHLKENLAHLKDNSIQIDLEMLINQAVTLRQIQIYPLDKVNLINPDLDLTAKILLKSGSLFHQMSFYSFKKLINPTISSKIKLVTKNKTLNQQNKRIKLPIIVLILRQIQKNHLTDHIPIVQRNQGKLIGMIVQNSKH